MKHRPRSLSLHGVKIVCCSCGHLASGETGEQLLHALEAHIDAAHARSRPAAVLDDADRADSTAQYPEEER
jgi:hypothetical protein